MELSIIIPVYNSEKYLDRTIKNVLSQRFKKFELILVDDGNWRSKKCRIGSC